jgi:hypothetical protein
LFHEVTFAFPEGFFSVVVALDVKKFLFKFLYLCP